MPRFRIKSLWLIRSLHDPSTSFSNPSVHLFLAIPPTYITRNHKSFVNLPLCKLVQINSVSVIQWLCNADKVGNSPPQRLALFFNTLFASLTRGARAVFQFYPESDDQVNLIMSAATRAGFTGGLVVDYPNSKKAKKFYLCLMTGPSPGASNKQHMELPAAYGTEEGTVQYEKGRKREERSHSRKGKKKDASSKDWILRKKSLYRQRGKEGVPNDSKYVSSFRSDTPLF